MSHPPLPGPPLYERYNWKLKCSGETFGLGLKLTLGPSEITYSSELSKQLKYCWLIYLLIGGGREIHVRGSAVFVNTTIRADWVNSHLWQRKSGVHSKPPHRMMFNWASLTSGGITGSMGKSAWSNPPAWRSNENTYPKGTCSNVDWENGWIAMLRETSMGWTHPKENADRKGGDYGCWQARKRPMEPPGKNK